jgi:F-type H+-transporting ATPase subunit a
MMHEISLKAEPLFDLFGLTITNTIFSSILVVITLLAVLIIKSGSFKLVPSGGFQIIFEFIYSFIGDLYTGIIHKDYKNSVLFSLLFCIFIYILVSNWFGLLPFVSSVVLHTHGREVPVFRAPTSDLSVTASLAIISVLLTNILGVSFGGAKYLSKYLNFKTPIDFVVGVLEFISEIGKVLSFSFRLFGNVFAGEVLLAVITSLTYGIFTLPFFGLEIFVGLIQALVFFLLTTVFISVAVSHEH